MKNKQKKHHSILHQKKSTKLFFIDTLETEVRELILSLYLSNRGLFNVKIPKEVFTMIWNSSYKDIFIYDNTQRNSTFECIIRLKNEFAIGKINIQGKTGIMNYHNPNNNSSIKIIVDGVSNILPQEIVLISFRKKVSNFFGNVLVTLKKVNTFIGITTIGQKGFITNVSTKDINRERSIEVIQDYTKHNTDLCINDIVQFSIIKVTSVKITCRVNKIIGNKLSFKSIETNTLIKHDWHEGFLNDEYDEANEQVKRYQTEISNKSYLNYRLDLTSELIFTIDGADAKDLDDAISIKYDEINKYYELGVHIADVSYFLKENGPLDINAGIRTTSCYLGDSVVPMIPPIISNDLCSLNPHTLKFCVSAIIKIDASTLKIIDYKLTPSVIKSSFRLIYSDVNDYFMKNMNKNVKDNYSTSLKRALDLCLQLHQKLNTKQRNLGKIDFITNELYYSFDKNTHACINVARRTQDLAENLIESFMVLANSVVAMHTKENNIPALYRIHDKPKIQSLNKAFTTASMLSNIHIQENIIHSDKIISQIIDKNKNKPYASIISMIFLRSMQKAKYDISPIGHYGLKEENYCHFTSPIRRYPDLLVHRMLYKYTFNKTSNVNKNKDTQNLFALSLNCNVNERKAVDMERECNSVYEYEYLKSLGFKSYDAYVSTVTFNGLYFLLDNYIEGFIHVANMDGYYEYLEDKNCLLNIKTNHKITLIQKIKVKVSSFNDEEKKVIFALS